MSAARNAIQVGALLGSAILVTAMTAARANASDPKDGARAPAVSAACETERRQAWFARQLRMSEGDSEPLQPPEPASCAPMETAKRAEGRGDAAVSSAANSGKDRR